MTANAKTAFETIRPNRRRHHAQALMHQVLQVVRPYLGPSLDEADRAEQRIAEELFALFDQYGVEVITDRDRDEMGLPPRGPDGWTVQEIWVLEAARFEAMTKNLTVEVPDWMAPDPDRSQRLEDVVKQSDK